MRNAMLRRYVAEFIGTFGIVFAPVALSASGQFAGADSGLMAAAWVSGLAVLAMIYALGHISAAHFNPAVTLGFAVARRFPWRYVLPYWIAEFLGGIVAAALAALLFGGGHGVHIPAPGPLPRAVGVEAVLTFFLMLVIIAVATDKRVNGAVPGLAIGLTVVFDVADRRSDYGRLHEPGPLSRPGALWRAARRSPCIGFMWSVRRLARSWQRGSMKPFVAANNMRKERPTILRMPCAR